MKGQTMTEIDFQRAEIENAKRMIDIISISANAQIEFLKQQITAREKLIEQLSAPPPAPK